MAGFCDYRHHIIHELVVGEGLVLRHKRKLTASVVAYYVTKNRRCTFTEADAYVRGKRPVIVIKPHLRKDILAFAEQGFQPRVDEITDVLD
ncbi:hypothetical protein SARC_16038 [Sphaeroforma arctica JP610]|uniref:Uncharacterized protein n=1 Tax=Sphaeroforma arctica JP610 TaxID=667725 RepID=A0A0L0F5G0_9EUKA|nr:hypothetical protein SARC_16038 [Sphaeroforma arctica JP610]KNC71423.1 hypothetical protein SARC_16038 [Sphaeroforma arctica JP610]|eukprot:XP_014145325.1 hypothetical protein SARC_16038 [Sphaeroforma arctica JP610]